MKFLHEKMLEIKSNGSSYISQEEVSKKDQNDFSSLLFFHPCVFCLLFFIVILIAAI